ncbi:MAG: hypothetical protein HKN47_03035, partial [Pirellulaceae bacterium]|nr:hypothetical protein [Pirellulaceae bacterium]
DIHTKLMAFQATGGGDQPESVNQALLESVEKIDWSDDPKVLKLIFLVGDAPPHMDYDETQYPEICALALKKDLIINTIQCGSIPTTKKFWTEIAYASEGQYVAILQSGGTVAVHTPFDKEIAELNGMLNDTICAYGDRRVQEMAMSKLRSQSAAKAESVADRADYLSKGRAGGSMGFGGNTVIIGTDDLVEMLMDESVTFENIDDKKLPDGLKKLQPSERRAELERRIAARKKFQAQMEDLVSKRADYIKTEREKNAGAAPMDAFDEQVKEIIHDQAAELGIEFSE